MSIRDALGLLVLAGCFGPGLNDMPFRCGQHGECPPDYQCDDGWCTKPGQPSPDAPFAIDAPPIDGRSCQAGTFLRCKDANTAVYCDTDGNGEVEQDCAFRCDAQLMLCLQCDPAHPTSCNNDTLQTCSATGELTTRDCDGWCEQNGNGAACVVLAPSNLSDTVCLDATQAELRISNDLIVDTTACVGGTLVLQPSPGPLPGPPSICLRVFREVRLENGAHVLASGVNALAIVATRTIEIDGTVDVGAEQQKSGAGVDPDRGLGRGKDATDPVIGGGGAGFSTAGPAATEWSAAGGLVYGNPTLIPLWPGAAGGRGGVEVCVMCGPPSPGGGGGGAIQIVSCGDLTLTSNARILGPGGGGAGGAAPLIGDGSGGGGGGSGGGILLEAERISISGNIVIAANGGGGGGGGDHLQGGLAGEPGSDGLPSLTPAPGGDAFGGAGAGGTGGTRGDVSPRGELPAAGHDSLVNGLGAGGAGGAAGRIRVNTRSGNPLPVPQGAVINPPPSVGAVGRHVVP